MGIIAVGLAISIAQLLVVTTFPERASAHILHPPIYIDGNGGFNASNGVIGGNGIPGDPFIIEGWEIDTSTAVGISIQNTNAYFVIRNVYVHSGSWQRSGITLSRVSNGRLENSTISGNSYGLRLDWSNNVVITASTISDNLCGIGAYSYSDVTITGNNISSNGGIGVLVSSDNATITGNNISSNGGEGLYLGIGARNATVKNNKLSWNGLAGLKFEDGLTDANITGNNIFSNDHYGIFDNGSTRFVTIAYNQIYSNNLSGIYQLASSNITIMYNNISSNIGYGIELQGGIILVHHNNFINNQWQAWDSGANQWDDGCPSGGNYWSNYSGVDSIDCVTGMAGSDGLGDAPYIIDANSKDNYPLMQPMWTNNTPPDVTVLVPNGGEDWTGNTVHTIKWTMYDDFDTNLTVWINYSANGTGWLPIPGAQGIQRPVGVNTFSWVVPGIDTTAAKVKVEAMDSSGGVGSDTSDWPFTIDSAPPFLLFTIPPDGSVNVPVDTNIQATFSEPMAQNASYVFVITPPALGNFSWPSPSTLLFDPHQDLSMCTQYTVYLSGFKDDSDPGNMMQGGYIFNFTIGCGNNPPTVSLLNPVGGEDWAGGFTKIISWNASDAEDPPANLTIDLHYTSGNASWIPIVLGLPGNYTSYPWSVPTLDTTVARVRVCATDTGNLTTCDTSGVFTIDSTPPQVDHTEPPDGAVNVPRDSPVKIFWTEPMNITVGAFIITPMIAGTLAWDTSGTMLQFTPTNLWPACTQITIGLLDYRDDSDPGNAMTTVYYFSFTTVCPGPPLLNLLRPVGGEYWRGGSQELVQWTASDAETPLSNLTFYLNYTSSVSSGPIAGPIKGATSLLWTLPSIDATDVRVNITAIDEDHNQSWDESGDFTIDSTPPSLASYGPIGQNVPLNALIDAFFDEPVSAMLNYTKESFGLLDEDAGSWVNVNWVRVPSGALFLQEFHFVPVSPLIPCTDYRAFINATFFDRAVWQLSNPVNWPFRTICPPSVSLSQPAGGEDWSGGSTHNIVYSMSDYEDSQLQVWINYSRNGGSDGYPYSLFTGFQLKGTLTLPWTLPRIDTTAARVMVTVMDSSGLTASALSGVFTIDSTPPSILTSVPSGGSSGVTITDDLQIVFSEPIVRASAEQGFSISPSVNDISFTWYKTVSGKDVLVVSHKPFKSKTDYTVSFSTALRDDSDPGNHPSAPLTIRFSTKPPPNVQPPVALAVGKNQVQVGEPVTLDGSGSTGTITRYVWTITDNQNNIVDVLEGRIATHTFTQNGRYAVTLRVIDESTGSWSEDTLEIVVTSSQNTIIILTLVASLALVSAAMAGTEVGRIAVFMLLAVPVHKRRMKGKEDAETRGMVKGYILVHPGDYYTDIKQNLQLNNGSLTWHLMKLEKEGLIQSQIQGTRKRYYPSGVPVPAENGGELHEVQKRLLSAISHDPGKPVSFLAEELGISSQLALYHIRKLSQRGLLSLERRGLRLRAYPRSNRNT